MIGYNKVFIGILYERSYEFFSKKVFYRDVFVFFVCKVSDSYCFNLVKFI